MQSPTTPTHINTPPRSPTQIKTRFQILQTVQTRKLHATKLQQQLTSFTHPGINLGAQTDAFASKLSGGNVISDVDEWNEALLKERRDALGPAALAAVAPGGFGGALGGYANRQKVVAAFSSGVNGFPPYIAGRSASSSVAPSSPFAEPIPCMVAEGDEKLQANTEDHATEHVDDNKHFHTSASTSSTTESQQPYRFIGGPSGLLTKPLIWHPRDRKAASMQRYERARAVSLPPQINLEPYLETDTLTSASASPRSTMASATPESPSVLAVERKHNAKLKRARNSVEDEGDDDEERQRPSVKVELDGLDSTPAQSARTNARKRMRAVSRTSPVEFKNETVYPNPPFGPQSEGSSNAAFCLNPFQLPTPLSLAVERKNLKRARESAKDDDEDPSQSKRVKFDKASTISEGAWTRMQVKTQTQRMKPIMSTPAAPLFRRGAQLGSMVNRLRRDSFGEITGNIQGAGGISTPVAGPVRRSARLQGKAGRTRMCVACPGVLNCYIQIA